MKFIALLALAFSVSAFAAAPEKVFVGKYEHNGDGEGCMLDSGTRVYVSLKKDLGGDEIILIETYATDVTFRELLLGSGKRVDPEARHLKQTWTSEFSGKNHFISVVHTKGENVDYITRQELILDGDQLIFTRSDDDDDVETCIADRKN
jgi:hypothetical protein